MEPLNNLLTEQAYEIVKFVGYKQHLVDSNVFYLNDIRLSFNLKYLVVHRLDEFGAIIASSKRDIDYRYFISELCKLHPHKMRQWKIKNVLLK